MCLPSPSLISPFQPPEEGFYVVGFLPLILACLHLSELGYLYFFFLDQVNGEGIFGFIVLYLESFRSSCIISCFLDLEHTLLYTVL